MTSVSVSTKAQRSMAAIDSLLRGLTVAGFAGLLGAELVAAPSGAVGLMRVAVLGLGTVITVLMAALAPDPVALLRWLARRPAAA